VAGRFVFRTSYRKEEKQMIQDRIAEFDDELNDSALDRSDRGTAPSKHCIGPRASPKPSWIDQA
jgi:hypothetical protein